MSKADITLDCLQILIDFRLLYMDTWIDKLIYIDFNYCKIRCNSCILSKNYRNKMAGVRYE